MRLVGIPDVLTLAGLVVAVGVYLLQRAVERRRDIDAARSLLDAVVSGIRPWGDLYFATHYDHEAAKERGKQDHAAVMGGDYIQVLRVPAAPLEALLSSPAVGGLIVRDTVQLASVALWHIGVFNQLVRQQTDFNTECLPEILDKRLDADRRKTLAQTAASISYMLHMNGIGDGEWYSDLLAQLDSNRDALTIRQGASLRRLARR